MMIFQVSYEFEFVNVEMCEMKEENEKFKVMLEYIESDYKFFRFIYLNKVQ